jgi:hypothetical protein
MPSQCFSQLSFDSFLPALIPKYSAQIPNKQDVTPIAKAKEPEATAPLANVKLPVINVWTPTPNKQRAAINKIIIPTIFHYPAFAFEQCLINHRCP